MIVDIQELPPNASLNADICIIGGGAAGITIGREFVATTHTVIILEGGGVGPEVEAQELYRSEIAGLPHRGTHDGRARVFGGTTTMWGGQALPLDAIDFERRPWVAHSGWPIDEAELEPYYRRAGTVLHLKNDYYDDRWWPLFGVQVPLFDRSKLSTAFSQWSPRPNFARTYRRQLKGAGNVDVILHANVVKIMPNPEATTVQRVDVRSLVDRRLAVRARYYVLCVGGIETARLLLASNDVDRGGLGNRYDLVGRYFQDHTAVRCGEVVPIYTNRRALHELFESFYRGRIKYLPKLRCSTLFQRRMQILNVLGNIVFDGESNPGIRAGKAAFNAFAKGRPLGNPGQAFRNIARNGSQVLRMAYRFGVQRRAFLPRHGPIYLEAHCEQEPNPESRVSLSEERDALGVPRARVDWRLTDLSWKTASVFARSVAAEFERLGLGRIEVAERLCEQRDGWERDMTDLNHHMGTARMHDDRRSGVVNRHCRVHDIDNLYIGSSAVFPTGGCSNPTLLPGAENV